MRRKVVLVKALDHYTVEDFVDKTPMYLVVCGILENDDGVYVTILQSFCLDHDRKTRISAFRILKKAILEVKEIGEVEV